MSNKKFKAKTFVFFAVVIITSIILIAVVPKIIGAAGYTIWLISPFVVAYLISLLLNPMVNGLEKRFKIPRGVCTIVVIILTIGVIGGVISAVLWKIIDEIKNVIEDWPIIYENILVAWDSVSNFFADFTAMLPDKMQVAMNNISEVALDFLGKLFADAGFVGTAGTFAKKLPGMFIVTIVFLLSLYFMITDSKKVSNTIRKPFSEKFLNKMDSFRVEVKRYVGGYIKAQLILMCISFTIILIGLSVLGIRYAPVIALLIAFVDALPFFGSGAILWPWSAVSFIMGNTLEGVGLIIIYLCVILMRQFLEPKIVSKNIGVHPLITLMSMYVGFKIFSLGGMILGPLVMVVIVSMNRAGVFEGIFSCIRKFFKQFTIEIKNITNSLSDKENEDEQ